jgi:hypothetical protein
MLDELRECAEVGVGDHEVLFAHDLADRPVTVRVPDIGAHVRELVDLSPRPGVRRPTSTDSN